MQLTFLQGQSPQSKTYSKRDDGSYISGSYPGDWAFTSHLEQVDTLESFREALRVHAEAGHCLVTNGLERAIEKESRAGLSVKDESREWIVLDIDGIAGFTDPEQFIQGCLPQPFHDVSYLIQHSASSGIKDGLRCHLFFLLYDSVDPRTVTQWLKYVNLATKSLSDEITLSKNSRALSFGLDVIANANGRIIYISPPNCEGFSDPVPDRVQLIEKADDRLSFNFASIAITQVREKFREKVELLRAAAGLPATRKNSLVYRYEGDREFIEDKFVEPARVTDWLEDNDRFMRCNLDGGDSFAYYFYRTNPKYLHNFKGEPSVNLEVMDPDFYRRVAGPDADQLNEKNPRPFVFRDGQTDKFYAGVRREQDIIEQPHVIGSKDKIEDYFLQHAGTSAPHHIETWDRVFDPERAGQYYIDDKVFNTWRPTKYMKDAMYRTNCPPTIERVIRHVTGNDEESYEHLMNWLAVIYQNRTKSGTAWVLHGCPGTGKGVLFSSIVRPIFGHDYCMTKQIRDLKEKFNGWMSQSLLVNVDETNAEDVGREAKEVVNALKMWITDPYMSMRQMQTDAYDARSYVNFIFTTNDFGILPIQDGDRRFNVAPRQEVPIILTEEDIAIIETELQDFAGYLKSYKANTTLAATPLENQAKADLRTAAQTSIDAFVGALKRGDLEYFIEAVTEETSEYQALADFKVAVERWKDDCRNGEESHVTVPELKAAYIVACRDKGMKSGAFKSMMAKRGFPHGKLKVGDVRWWGWRTKWWLSKEETVAHRLHLSAVKTEEEIVEGIENELEKS